MHTEDGDEDSQAISNYYGIVPGIVGLVLAGGLCWIMFALADGFS